MAIHLGTRTDTQPALRLRQLVEGRGLGRYAFFFVTGEGDEFPDGTEESSGFVLNEDGRVFSFWLGWDAARGAPIFAEWEQVEAEAHWMRSAEYRRARERVGLA